MTRDPAAAVLADFRAVLNDAIAAHSFACMGLSLTREFFQQGPRVPENPDPEILIGIGDPNLPSARQYAGWRLSKAIEQVARGGPVETRLGQQWLVYMFTVWEHEYRSRLAAAHGCSTDDLSYPLLGDLRRLRHDVVHHHGIATRDQTGRCEVLGHWFKPGDRIHLRVEHFAEFVDLIPWEEMMAGPSYGG